MANVTGSADGSTLLLTDKNQEYSSLLIAPWLKLFLAAACKHLLNWR